MAEVLRISVSTDNDCTSFDVTDATGAYAVTNTGGFGAPNITTADITAATIKVTKFGGSTTYTKNVYSTFPSSASASVTVANTDIGLSSTATITDGIYLIRYDITGSISIASVATGSGGSFTVAGNRSGVFAVGDTFTITGSTNNNATWTITAVTFNTGPNSTTFTVSGTVGATADGAIGFTGYTSVYQMFYCSANSCLLEKLADLEVNECTDCLKSELDLISKIDIFLSAAKYAALCSKPNKAKELLDYVNALCGLQNCTTCS